jgi:hypothetical protein
MGDDPDDYPPTPRAGQISATNQRTVEALLDRVLPLIK